MAGQDEFTLRFAERRTDTPNQVADLGLKLGAAGLPPPMVWTEMGYDPTHVQAQAEEWAKRTNPYPVNPAPPGPQGPGAAPVSITPGNAPKGGSATSIGVAGSNGGRGRG